MKILGIIFLASLALVTGYHLVRMIFYHTSTQATFATDLLTGLLSFIVCLLCLAALERIMQSNAFWSPQTSVPNGMPLPRW